jgi:hypothetical protein
VTVRFRLQPIVRALVGEANPERAARSLAVFRILLSAVLLWQGLATAKALPLLAGEFGFIQRTLNDALAPRVLPRIAWFLPQELPAWLSEKHIIYLLFSGYLISLFYLLIGYKTKAFAALSLFFHLLFKASSSASAYGAHELSTSGLFFCLVMPVDCFYAMRARGASSIPESIDIHRFGIRAYMSLVYVSSGIEKLSGEDWRSGVAMWNFLMRPEVTWIDFGWLSQAPWLATGLAWFVLVVEIGYVLCLFLPRLRGFWLILILALHLGIGLTMQLWFFSLTMAALNVGALGGSRDHRREPGGARFRLPDAA